MKMTSNKFLTKYYDDKATEYNELSLTYDSQIPYKKYFFLTRFNKVFSALNPKKNEKILEIGCGTGYYTKKIAIRGSKIVATDISVNYINQAKNLVKRNKNVNFKLTSGSELPFENNSFDKVLFTEVIEHIPNYKKSIAEVNRVLVSDGLLVISTPSIHSPLNICYKLKKKIKKYKFNEHIHEFTSGELRSLLVKNGFSIVDTRFCNFLFPYPVDLLFLKIKSEKKIEILFKIENFFQSIPIVNRIGWTIVITAVKNN